MAEGPRFSLLRKSLRFEQLEDRRVLSADTWMVGSGAWNTAANWSAGIPTSASQVTISTASAATITISSVVSVASITMIGSKDSLSIAGGSLTTAQGLTNSGTITVSAGCNLTVNGIYSQAAGASLSLPGGGSIANPATNLATNSDIESPVVTNSTTPPNSWGYWGASYVSTQYAYTGAQSLMMSGADSGVVESFSVTSGASYTVSADAMTPAGNSLTGNETGQLQLLFFNSSDALISSYSAPNSINVLTALSTTGGPLPGSVGGQGWNQFNTSAVAPSNAATAEVIATTQLFDGAGGGSVFWDDIQFGRSPSSPSAFVAGSISNSGTITVGPSNTVTSNGTFTQTSTGTLDVQLGGAPSLREFGLVDATGAATLAGTLKSDLVYGYAPSNTDSFIPIEFASESGTFSSYSLPSGPTYQFGSAVTFTNVVLSAAPTTAVTATINANANVHAATTNLLGVNLAYWDDQQGTAQTQQMVTAAGLDMYRFPGGSASDDFHFNVSNNWGDSAANTIPQFVQFISAVNGTGLVTVDYGSGSPQEAAAELAYLQGSATDTTTIGMGIEWNDSTGQWQNVNWGTVGYWASLRAASPLAVDDGLNFMRIDHPAPFADIKYWEIGNEEYGNWEVDHHGTLAPGGVSTGAPHDPATYAAFAKQFSTLATEILSTAGPPGTSISIGIDSADPTGLNDNNWTQNVLADGLKIGFVPGFISDHSYMQAPGSESDSFLLNQSDADPGSIQDWSTRYAAYESLLQQTLSSQASSVTVMATEFNSVYSDPGKQSTSLVNGLFIANSIGSMLESGYSGGFAWDLRNYWQTNDNNSNLLYGWREGGDYGQLGDPSPTDSDPPSTGAYIAYPGYYALQLASKIVAGGGEVVSATSNYGDLDVYAVRESNGHLDLLVINTNPVASVSDQFNLTGFQPSASAHLWQYGETQDTAQSQTADGSSGLASSSATLNLSGANFSDSFPAYSMTLLDLQPAAPVLNLGGSGGNFAATFVQGRGAVSIVSTSNLSVTDAGNLTGAAIAISNPPDGSAEALAVSSAALNGTGVTATPGAGSLTLSGTASASVYQSILQTLTYNDTAASPNLSNRTVSFTVTDANSLSSAPVTTALTFAAAHAPSVTNAATQEDTQTTSGLVIAPSALDAGTVTNFQITNITGGTLFQNNGVTQIHGGDFISVAQGAAGLKFTPTTGSTAPGSFTVQASTVATAAGLGGSTIQATITVSPPPEITGVYVSGTVSGSAWTTPFDNYLAANGFGNASIPSLGFALQTGASQLTTIPWTNINTISVQFNENVNVIASLLTAALSGNSAANTPPGTTVTYNAATYVATFTLPGTQVLSANTYMLTIPTGSVLDGNGAGLDGAFTNHSTTVTGQAFPSGLGTGVDSNADFNFLFNVLPGAAKRGSYVLGADATFVRNQLGEGTIATDSTPPFSSPYADVNGQSFILGAAVTAARNALGQGLPTGTPPSPPVASADVSEPVVSTDADTQSSAGPPAIIPPVIAPPVVVQPVVVQPVVVQPEIVQVSIASPPIVQPAASESVVAKSADSQPAVTPAAVPPAVVTPAVVTQTAVTQTAVTQTVVAQTVVAQTVVAQSAVTVAQPVTASVAVAQAVSSPAVVTSAMVTPASNAQPVIVQPVAFQPDVTRLDNMQNGAAKNAQCNVAQAAVVQTRAAAAGSTGVPSSSQPSQAAGAPPRPALLDSRENAVDAAITDFELADVLEPISVMWDFLAGILKE